MNAAAWMLVVVIVLIAVLCVLTWVLALRRGVPGVRGPRATRARCLVLGLLVLDVVIVLRWAGPGSQRGLSLLVEFLYLPGMLLALTQFRQLRRVRQLRQGRQPD